MNKRRLLKLADLLEADAKNKKGIKFDLNIWAKTINAASDEVPGKITVSCGTQACAVGLACISGAFKRSGFTYEISTQDDAGGNNIVPVFGVARDFDAVEAFFDLTGDEAEFLFMDTEYRGVTKGARSELAVAKRIRNFVATGTMER